MPVHSSLVALLVALSAVIAGGCSGSPAPIYTVEQYDPDRDPESDLAEVVTLATSQNKRIILQVGGEWCRYCHLLEKYFRENASVARVLQDNYLLTKIHWSKEQQNEDFLGALPEISGFPHLFILEKDGTLLHSQSTGVLEADSTTYDEKAVLALLNKWAPTN